jgi:hypothetical protein
LVAKSVRLKFAHSRLIVAHGLRREWGTGLRIKTVPSVDVVVVVALLAAAGSFMRHEQRRRLA